MRDRRSRAESRQKSQSVQICRLSLRTDGRRPPVHSQLPPVNDPVRSPPSAAISPVCCEDEDSPFSFSSRPNLPEVATVNSATTLTLGGPQTFINGAVRCTPLHPSAQRTCTSLFRTYQESAKVHSPHFLIPTTKPSLPSPRLGSTASGSFRGRNSDTSPPPLSSSSPPMRTRLPTGRGTGPAAIT